MPLIDPEDPMFDFASIELAAGGTDYAVKEVKYDSDMDGATVVFANSVRPVGRTLGRLKVTASMTMYTSEGRRFLKGLGQGFKRKIFAIVVKFSVPGSDIVTDTIQRCRITKVSGGGSEGGDATTMEFTLQPLGILWNGLDPIGEALTAT